MLLISVSHLMHKYFYILLMGLAGLIWLSRFPSSGTEGVARKPGIVSR